MNDHDFDQPGTLAYYATLLEDPTTTISMSRPAGGSLSWYWTFEIATPEDLVKYKAHGNWVTQA